MKKYYLLLGLILIFAFFLRGLEVITSNYLFLFDHGHYYLDIRDELLRKKIPLIGTQTPVRGIFQGPGWYYLLTLAFLVGRGDPYYGMALMLVLSLLTVLAAFFVARELWGEKTALITAFLFTTAPISIKTTRHMWPPYPLLLVIVFYIFWFFKLLEGKKNAGFWLGIFTGLTFHFEVAFGIFLLPTTIFILWFYRSQLSWRAVILACSGLLITLLPQIIFDLRHDFIQTHGIIDFVTGRTQDILMPKPLPTSLWQHLFMFAGTLRESVGFPNEMISRWWLLGFFIILSTFIFVKATKQEKKTIKVLVMILLGVFFFYGFYRQDLWEWYLIGLGTIYIFLLGLTLAKLLEHRYLKFFVLIFFLAVSFFALRDLKETYYPRPKIDPNFAFVKAKKEVIDSIYRDADGQPFGVFVYTPPIYDYPYEYLFWWYGQKKYGYLPNKSKERIFYLIIEPNPEQPWGAKGWLETVIKEGQVVFDTTFPSGLRLQKREGIES